MLSRGTPSGVSSQICPKPRHKFYRFLQISELNFCFLRELALPKHPVKSCNWQMQAIVNSGSVKISCCISNFKNQFSAFILQHSFTWKIQKSYSAFDFCPLTTSLNQSQKQENCSDVEAFAQQLFKIFQFSKTCTGHHSRTAVIF